MVETLIHPFNGINQLSDDNDVYLLKVVLIGNTTTVIANGTHTTEIKDLF